MAPSFAEETGPPFIPCQAAGRGGVSWCRLGHSFLGLWNWKWHEGWEVTGGYTLKLTVSPTILSLNPFPSKTTGSGFCHSTLNDPMIYKPVLSTWCSAPGENSTGPQIFLHRGPTRLAIPQHNTRLKSGLAQRLRERCGALKWPWSEENKGHLCSKYKGLAQDRTGHSLATHVSFSHFESPSSMFIFFSKLKLIFH